MHVTEIDLQHNHKFSRFWDDVGRLASLTRLCLQHTGLYEFPPSFMWLTQLKHLDLTHCCFKELPLHLGELSQLEYLNLRDNMMIELPSTFHHLTNLKYLDLSGNGMAFLAIKPLAEMADPKVVAAWEVLESPAMHGVYYHNTITGESRKAMPEALKIARVVEQQEKEDAERRAKHKGTKLDKPLVEGTKRYNDKRTALAAQGVPEFECVVDRKAGTIFYKNHVNGETSWEMPPAMDTFGICGGLVTLKLNNNLLRDLPESVSCLASLRLLECKTNYLKKLPFGLGECRELRVIKVPTNELSELPDSMAKLENLSELVLTANSLTVFPAWVGDLKGLRQLFIGNNRLESLPYKLGYCTDLTDLQVYNNPLVDPPYEKCLTGLDRLLFELRQKFLEATQGPTPPVHPHRYGIGDEKIEILPLFQRRLQKLLNVAKETKELDLIQNGLFTMPPKVHELLDLKRLNLSAQHFRGLEGRPKFPEGMAQLASLWIKRCELNGVDESVGLLRGLKDIDLSENSIEDISHKVFRHLKKLEVINLSRNHLYALPEEIGLIPYLKELHLEMNRLDFLPDSLTKLKGLEVLNVSLNNLSTVPPGLGALETLRVLNLEGNQLHRLPPGMGNLRLSELRVSHNRLEVLDEDLMDPNLKHSVEVLRFSNNNLLELPPIFDSAPKLKQLLIDYNPMVSPPSSLLEESLETVLQYMRLRTERFREVSGLLESYGFEVEPDNFHPVARGALVGNTGFLTPADQAHFDKNIDAYINGEFYQCELSAAELVDNLDNLRHERGYVFNSLIIQELVGVCRQEFTKSLDVPPRKRFSANVLRGEGVRRPWGRGGEKVRCYAITLESLLEDAQPNPKFVRRYRPSLFALAVQKLPITVFDYKPDMLRKAVQDFEGPYGMVGEIEDAVTFEEDEYFDAFGKHRATFPAVLPALVVTRIVYTGSEARRRQEEDEELWVAFKDMERDLADWVSSRTGQKRLSQATKFRHREVATAVTEGETKKREATAELARAEQEVLDVAERRQDFEDGKPFFDHRIGSLEQAIELGNAADEAVKIKKAELNELIAQVEENHRKLQMNKKQKVYWCTKDLKRKYGHVVWKELVEQKRQEAREQGWRRPWDGVDGEAYEAWAELQYRVENNLAKPPPLEEWEILEEDPDDRDDFEWRGTENMKIRPLKEQPFGEIVSGRFDSEAYLRYLHEMRPEELTNPWDRPGEKDEEEEEGSEDGEEGSEEESGEEAE